MISCTVHIKLKTKIDLITPKGKCECVNTNRRVPAFSEALYVTYAADVLIALHTNHIEPTEIHQILTRRRQTWYK